MKATEVRIGNYIEVEGDHARLKTLVMGMPNKGLKIEYAGLAPKEAPNRIYPYDRCSPITLTADWLEAFDFIYNNGTWNYHDLILSEKDGGFNFAFNFKNIQVLYVHQLQNVYYVLFDEELKLNYNAIF